MCVGGAHGGGGTQELESSQVPLVPRMELRARLAVLKKRFDDVRAPPPPRGRIVVRLACNG